MRVAVLGGTGFVGSSIVRELAEHGHEPIAVHRGVTEPPDRPESVHVHGSRMEFRQLWGQLRDMSPDALIDVAPYSRDDAQRVLHVVPDGIRLCVLSSVDVYSASGALRGKTTDDPVPLDEAAPLRDERYMYRDATNPLDDYEKLDVEEEYGQRAATILRLPMIYGPGDKARREEFILRRCRAHRDSIPVGPGSLLWSRGYVGDVAAAVCLVIESAVEGQVFNICEAQTWSVLQWSRQIVAAANWHGEFVRVHEDVLPADLRLSASFEGHLLFDASKARRMLGWTDTDPVTALRASVDWHLAHPPEASANFTDDDAALAADKSWSS